MKINFSKQKAYFGKDISLAKANGCEAILIPLDFNCEPYLLDNIWDMDDIYDFAYDIGWDKFLLIDFIEDREEIINLYELEIA